MKRNKPAEQKLHHSGKNSPGTRHFLFILHCLSTYDSLGDGCLLERRQVLFHTYCLFFCGSEERQSTPFHQQFEGEPCFSSLSSLEEEISRREDTHSWWQGTRSMAHRLLHRVSTVGMLGLEPVSASLWLLLGALQAGEELAEAAG